jgi:MoxR-like ATPase
MMLELHGAEKIDADELDPVATGREVEEMIAIAQAIHVAPSLRGYVVDLAAATRRHPQLALGMSPRAALALQRAARARAAASGREYVIPDDLKAVAGPVLEHRLSLTPEAQLQGLGQHDVLTDVLSSVPVPSGRS